MGQHKLMGIIALLIGISIILNIIGLASLLIGPLILFAIAYYLIRSHHPILGAIFGVIGLSNLLHHLFHFDVGNLFISLLFVYIGYRLLTGKGYSRIRHRRKKRKKNKHKKQPIDLDFDHDTDWIDEEMERLKKSQQKTTKNASADAHTQQFEQVEPTIRSALLGDFHLMNRHFELEDLIIRNGIGDVKIDLTKAIIPEGETVLVVNAWIGDIDIYVPYDLELAVSATVTIGDLDILSDKQGGFQRHLSLKSKNFDTSTRRVKLILSLLIGDIDVRVL